jgi:hypothetical protein
MRLEMAEGSCHPSKMKASALYVTSTVAWGCFRVLRRPGTCFNGRVARKRTLAGRAKISVGFTTAAEMTHWMPARMKATLDDWITGCALAKRVKKPRTRVDAWLHPPIAEFECVLSHVASLLIAGRE